MQQIEELKKVHGDQLVEELGARDVQMQTSLEKLVVSAYIASSCMCFPQVTRCQPPTGGASANNVGPVEGGPLPFCYSLLLNVKGSSLDSVALIHSTSASWPKLYSKSKRCNRRVLR